MALTCEICRKPLPDGKFYCRACKHYNFSTYVARTSADGASAGGHALIAQDDETVLLSDATIGEVERIKTFSPYLDTFFGGGIVRTAAYLIGGEPGAGKTTLFLQLANHFAKIYDREVIYIANEQSPGEIRITGLRLKLSHLHRIRIVKAMGGLRSNLFELLDRFKPCLSIVDSLTKLVGNDLPLAVKVAEDLKATSVEFNNPAFIVNQVTKGLEHAGLEKLQHAVDATSLMYVEGQHRYLVSSKDRNAEAPLAIKMSMSETGLSILGMGDNDDDEDDEK